MSKVTVRVLGAADGKTKTDHDGRYVVDWTPHTEAGICLLVSTPDRTKARVFESIGEALDEWKTVSRLEPVRPWDGKPNRPLTALTIDMQPYEPDTGKHPQAGK